MIGGSTSVVKLCGVDCVHGFRYRRNQTRSRTVPYPSVVLVQKMGSTSLASRSAEITNRRCPPAPPVAEVNVSGSALVGILERVKRAAPVLSVDVEDDDACCAGDKLDVRPG